MAVNPPKVASALREIFRAGGDAAALHCEQERVVEIEGDVAGEGHVPALPVLGDAGGFVGRVEVEREADGEDAGQAERHVGVAGEVEVELHGVDDEASPGGGGGERAGVGEGEVGGGRELVGDEDFFGEAHEEPGEAEGDVLGIEGEAAGRWDGVRASSRVLASSSGRIRPNCGIISLWWRMGPAMRWGKKVTKRR